MPEIFYCTWDDVKDTGVSEKKLIDLCGGDQDNPAALKVFDGCRRSAKAEIDGYAMTKYSGKIPFSPVPDAIVTIAAILTKYYLYARKSSVDEQLEKLYNAQVKKLEGLQNGRFKIEQEDTPVSEDPVQFTDKKPEDRAFHPSNMPGYFP